MSPAAIDAYVHAQLAAGEDLYTLHADALTALSPDRILTQDLCRVLRASEPARGGRARLSGLPR